MEDDTATAASMAIIPFSYASPFAEKLKLEERLFEICGIEFRIKQSYKPDGKGGTKLGFGASVYDSSFVLGEWLARQS